MSINHAFSLSLPLGLQVSSKQLLVVGPQNRHILLLALYSCYTAVFGRRVVLAKFLLLFSLLARHLWVVSALERVCLRDFKKRAQRGAKIRTLPVISILKME